LTDEVEFCVARWVVLPDHGVAGGQHHLTANDEDGTKGLITPGVRLLGECKGLAQERFVGRAGAHHAAALDRASGAAESGLDRSRAGKAVTAE
jgi:hypothetical protein